MFTLRAVILALAASAAPALSAPLSNRDTADIVNRDASTLAARDPGPSGGDIRDFLEDLELRSEDDSTGLYRRDIPNHSQYTRDDNLVRAISLRELPDYLKRDGLGDDIRARGFFDSIADGLKSAGNTVLKGIDTASNAVVSGVDSVGNKLTGSRIGDQRASSDKWVQRM
ncbi:hypothetical protein EI94DRAFT_1701417 [Lactarius quietus]|nr:hypothetical protein EI94DRAFT_1701417 [Lactarius quietus]